MTNHTTSSASTVEDARHALCHRLAEIIRNGDAGIQIRFVLDGVNPLVWVYTKKEHEWKRADDLNFPIHHSESLLELLEGLVAQKYSDAWTCHRTDHRDRSDFELKFNRESIVPHVKEDLEAYLFGCLSHSHHDSGKDARRRIHFRKG